MQLVDRAALVKGTNEFSVCKPIYEGSSILRVPLNLVTTGALKYRNDRNIKDSVIKLRLVNIIYPRRNVQFQPQNSTRLHINGASIYIINSYGPQPIHIVVEELAAIRIYPYMSHHRLQVTRCTSSLHTSGQARDSRQESQFIVLSNYFVNPSNIMRNICIYPIFSFLTTPFTITGNPVHYPSGSTVYSFRTQ